MGAGLTDRVLVTGATGLIGTWFVDLWPRSGRTLVPIASANVDLLAEGAARHLLETERPHTVVHLAWCASGNPGYRDSNDNDGWVRTSIELSEAAEELGVQCWFTGTVVDDPQSTQAGTLDRYSQSKMRLRRQLGPLVNAGAIGWFQPTYVVDPERGRPALVSQAASAAASGHPLTLRTPGDRHDFVHAGDVAQAMILAVRTSRTGLLPIGSGRSRPVCELATALGATWVDGSVAEAPSEQHSSAVADIRWLTELGWGPRRTDELFDVNHGPRRQA